MVEVVLREGLRSIGREAFHTCGSLEQIHLPSTLQSIGNNAFGGCINLRNVVLREGVVADIGNAAF